MVDIQIYCPRCNKREIINHVEKDKPKDAVNEFSIPVPNFANGLSSYSVVHSDHTLILDIDANGDVRGENIVDRIDQNLEKYVAIMSSRISELIQKCKEKSFSMFIISEDHKLVTLMLGMFQNLILNLPDGFQGNLSFSKEQVIFEFENLLIYVGMKSPNFKNLITEESLCAFHLTESNYSKISDEISKSNILPLFKESAILFESNFLNNPINKEKMMSLSVGHNIYTLLDISTHEKATFSLLRLFSNLISKN